MSFYQVGNISKPLIKPWQAPLNKAPNKGGKEEQTKERENPTPTVSHKSKNPNRVIHKGQRNKICPHYDKRVLTHVPTEIFRTGWGVSLWVFRTPLYYTLFR